MESLYRRYRPQTFADVVGQQHVVTTLERAVVEGRTSHAYLFCGPRGTGKTTMARLLAKALMCDAGPGALPDGTCEQCALIAAGEHPDVYELDAASRTGVDNVREEIVGSVAFAPVRGRVKVYIVDEVHMLTTAAFNALLKTLEEPPGHVVFVLCTTDPQKVPETILSRVQRFDFHAIGADDIVARLALVAEREGIEADPDALALVARHARGGMRDALASLEQLATFGGGAVTRADAEALLGTTSVTALATAAKALAARDVPTLFALVAELADAGRDLLQFTRELAAHLRDAYVVAVVGGGAGTVTMIDDAASLADEAAAFGDADRIARALAVLADAALAMRTSPNQRLVLEIALTRIARPGADLTLEAVAERVSVLEARMDALLRAGTLTQGGGAAVAPPSPDVVPSAPEDARPPASLALGGVQAGVAASPMGSSDGAAPATGSSSGAAASRVQPSVDVPPQAPPTPVPEVQVQAVPAGPAPTQAATAAGAAATPSEPAAPVAPAVETPLPVASDGDLQRRWKQVVQALIAEVPARGSLLASATLEHDDGSTLHVTLPKGSTFATKMLMRQDVQAAIAPVVERVFGRRRMTYAESSLVGADIARSARQGGASAEGVPAGRASATAGGEGATTGAVAVTRAASASAADVTAGHGHASSTAGGSDAAPVTGVAQVTARDATTDAASSNNAAGYPMPWDAPTPSEAPPYDDVDVQAYGTDAPGLSGAATAAYDATSWSAGPSDGWTSPATSLSAATPMRHEAPASETPAEVCEHGAGQAPPVVPTLSGTADKAHVSSASAGPEPTAVPDATSLAHGAGAAVAAPTPQKAPTPTAATTTSTDGLTDEQRAVLQMLTGVFGDGVTMTPEA